MNKSDTKTKLIEVGVKIILEKGYHAAGLMEILSEAKVPKGSFYHYFKSKEDFCIAIINYYSSEYIEKSLSSLLIKTMSARERILLFFNNERNYYLRQQCKQGCLVVKMITEMSQVSTPIRIELQNGINIWLKALASCIKEGIDAGEIKAIKSPEFMAEYIHSAWMGALTRMQVYESVQPLDNFMEFLIQQIS
ncbi:MAG: TetR/AcrR family transcriptional regulator [Bacillota bacterium]|nr:TetR/AcrR family transcriptional regulator [Bacillota bacterium]